MAARRRPAAAAAGAPATQPPTADAAAAPGEPAKEPVLRPPNLGVAAAAAVLFLAPFSYLAFVHYPLDADLRGSILKCGAMSLGGFFIVLKLIPVAARYHLRRRMFGYDINKKGLPTGEIKVPEALGLVVGIVYLVTAIIFQQFHYAEDSIWLVEYNAALASVCFMILLGFVDDVLDIPWRVKLALPTIAALPLLMAYAGGTSIIIPKPLTSYVGLTLLELGSSTDIETQQAHEFSIYLVLPFLTTSLALLAFNWYPSIVFVGDTYTYFAGMALAVVGILGHFRFDPQTGLLTGTKDGNLVNIFLRLFGKCSEKALCIRLLIFQFYFGIITLVLMSDRLYVAYSASG
ncbi:UDP-N-acetylglucosamine--dolichyl-phosphate N-acetylglucosaminephosphotransferase [Panicum miliaceum]|uniref:UDP-N-acetylglucosamine--dolichyl-phosphate N-acetylglucosaminephosphotransferase n=1 Tax=Panicum miliaceum TaxID=4540 RepID=A0A3L6TFH6_PANMI|nr:UDP-N-acetylglucosamine--dolichyl-phosphate N-acetylglucosaminephosphotransferase [Panicum miliaceum]